MVQLFTMHDMLMGRMYLKHLVQKIFMKFIYARVTEFSHSASLINIEPELIKFPLHVFHLRK